MNEHDVFFIGNQLKKKNQIIYRSCSSRNNRSYKLIFEEKLSLKGDFKERFDLGMKLLADDKDHQNEMLLYMDLSFSLRQYRR